MLKNTNINKVEISHVLFNKVTLLTLTRRPSGHGIKNCQERFFIKVWTIHTQNVEEQEIVSKDFLEMYGPYIHKMLNKRWVFDDSDETEITLFFTDLSQQFEIYLVAFVHDFLIYVMDMGLIYLKSSVT